MKMKFITEEDLRDLYKKEPYDSYELEAGARLTPGARQFLTDRGILKDYDDFSNMKKTVSASGSLNAEENAASKKAVAENQCKNSLKDKKLFNRMKSIDAMILLTEEELLKRDVCLAQSVIGLRKQFACIRKAVISKEPVENLCCHECTGIHTDNFSSTLEDCFEITEFHVQLEKGKEIINLHKLRCSLQELEPMVQELYENSNEENARNELIIGKVNQIINSLSQLICSAFGGKRCQRQG
jgi:ethanolamine utilization cobalamin adenosyltransferase